MMFNTLGFIPLTDRQESLSLGAVATDLQI